MGIKDFLHHRYGLNMDRMRDPILFSILITVFVTAMFSIDSFKIWPLIIGTAITAYAIYSVQNRCHTEYGKKLDNLRVRLQTIKDGLKSN